MKDIKKWLWRIFEVTGHPEVLVAYNTFDEIERESEKSKAGVRIKSKKQIHKINEALGEMGQRLVSKTRGKGAPKQSGG